MVAIDNANGRLSLRGAAMNMIEAALDAVITHRECSQTHGPAAHAHTRMRHVTSHHPAALMAQDRE